MFQVPQSDSARIMELSRNRFAPQVGFRIETNEDPKLLCSRVYGIPPGERFTNH